MSNSASALVDALDEVLDRERLALTSGRLDQVERLIETKERLVDQLNGVGEKEPGLRDLRVKAERNRLLLDSAMQGIRGVADRLAELQRVRLGTDTYDQNGRKARLHVAAPPKLEKRA